MKRFLSAGVVIAVAIVVFGSACPPAGEQPPPDTTAAVAQPAPGVAGAVVTCDTAAGFDPDQAHHSRRRRIQPGVLVSIVPHLQSNQYTLADLWAGKIVGKFVNHGDQPYDKLALTANGQSCYIVRGVEGEGLVAEAVEAGSQTGRRLHRLALDFHDSTHATPLARWINVPRRQLESAAMGMAMTPVMQLIGFAAVQDSSPAPGPGAWVTCVTNGCCRVSADE